MFSFDLTELLIVIIVFLIALSFHEAAHAFMAHKLGDPTAKTDGRLTLDPRAHLDPFGTLAIIIMQFGWGKPVPVIPEYFENPRRDMALVSLAGPGANFALAFLGMLLFGVLMNTLGELPLLANQFFMTFIYINVFLGVFNFIPLPPLDGGSILLGILPKSIVPPVSNFLEMHGAVIFFSLLAVNLVFQIPIITGPVLYLSGIIIQLFTLILSPFLINTAGL